MSKVMGMKLNWKEINRDEVWKAARKRVEDSLGFVPGVTTREVPDYWVLDELHAEALEMAAKVSP